jgi:hypothetical protein
MMKTGGGTRVGLHGGYFNDRPPGGGRGGDDETVGQFSGTRLPPARARTVRRLTFALIRPTIPV